MRGTGQGPVASTPQNTAVVSNSAPVVATSNTDGSNNRRLRFDGPSIFNPNTRPQGSFRINPPPTATVDSLNPLDGYSINIVDRFGNTVRQFNSQEQYQKFIDEQMQRANQPATPDSLRLPDGK
jgi:hypothetical protein